MAGQDAGSLTADGAALLDPTGTSEPGVPLCPPEGDAGTGMVATNSVAARTGNISAGTSVFAMVVVLERPLTTVHPRSTSSRRRRATWWRWCTATTARANSARGPACSGSSPSPWAMRLVFDTDAGPGVVLAMSEMRDRFRLTANVVDVVPPDADLPHLPVARAVWKPAATSAEAWLMAGAAHYTVLTTQVGVDVFADFAEMTGTELLAIDEATTARSFARELKWNQAYYRLAQGFGAWVAGRSSGPACGHSILGRRHKR